MQLHVATLESPLTTLLNLLHKDVESLQGLARLLREERECVVFFDVQGLMGALERKNQMLKDHQTLHSTLQQAAKACWQECGPRRIEEPEDLPECLRLLGESIKSSNGQRLVEFSSEIVALVDVVRELHEMNKELVQRSVSWITSYVADLVDSSTASTYDVTGRMGRVRQSPRLIQRLI